MKKLKLFPPLVHPSQMDVKYVSWPFKNGPGHGAYGLYCARRPKGYANIGFIYINPKQTDKQKLRIAIHEALHATYPDLNERQVLYGATHIADIVHKAGFRKQKKNRSFV